MTIKFNESDSVRVNELRFAPRHHATDLQKFLLKNYGQPQNRIESTNKYDYLVWTDVKLLDTSEELFTVAVGGEEKRYELLKINGKQKYGETIYCSAIVFDSKGFDSFRSSSEFRQPLADFFINGSKKVTTKTEKFRQVNQ